jgi:hypothetical protein
MRSLSANSDRECPHELYCWYRVHGRCCHSCVEDIAHCKGYEPSTFYVQLMNRAANQPVGKPRQADESPSDQRLVPLYVRGLAAS